MMVGTQLMQEDPKKILVVVDEAHRGVPDDGSHMAAIARRYAKEHFEVLFTKAPARLHSATATSMVMSVPTHMVLSPYLHDKSTYAQETVARGLQQKFS